MKYFLSLLIVMTTSVSSIKHRIHPMEVIASMADLIVAGKIESIGSDCYEFRINKIVKGQSTNLINVEMFKEWTCDTRMKKVEKGEELFLFLHKEDGRYKIINGSNGEIFIQKGKVLRTLNDRKPTIDELSVAIKTLTDCFEFKGYSSEGDTFIQLKPDNEIKDLAKTSELVTWFFDRIQKHYEIEK